MRKLLILSLFLAGCGGGGYYRDYDIGAEKQATVGSVMVTVSNQNNVASHTSKIVQQLIYGGVTARVARIAYREFGEDLSKPIFFQDLQYDLNESDMIIFQDLTIQVLDASSKQIRFKVLTGPMDPNSPDRPGKKESAPVFPL